MPSFAALSPLGKLATVASASVAAASVTYVAVNPPFAPKDDETNDVVVCVASDATLRHAPAGQPCLDGQQRVALSPHAPDAPTWEDWDAVDKDLSGAATPTPGSVANLERRLSELEATPWFEVVDKAGHRIFTVAPGVVSVYNNRETLVGAIRATDSGGFFVAHSASGAVSATVGASGAKGGVRVLEGGVIRAEIGRHAEGNYSLRFPSPAHGNFAGIGESRAGTGALVIADAAGKTRASLTVDEGKGMAGIFNPSGSAIVSLTEGATHGGLLAIGDASSNPMVKMGVQDNRYGIVLTGPKAGLPLIPNSGLPGSYIIGCTAQCGPGGK